MTFLQVYKLIKAYNGSVLVGILAYAFYFFAINATYFSGKEGYTYYALGFGTFTLYAVIYYLLKKDWLRLTIVGTVFGICIVTAGIYIKASEIYQTISNRKSKLQKSVIIKVEPKKSLDTLNCIKYRYGSFLMDNDTLIRFKKGSNDLQSFKNEIKAITWTSPCSYYIISKNNVVLSTYNLNTFEDDYFYTTKKCFSVLDNCSDFNGITIPLEN
ncbi:hypothetical protein [Aurantibacter aestuarii]|uniref:Uncharacterized protein n=1 Tax=Aurantibacter aestuarii TaxID=1266046 RepID=A0A2T1N5L1_9FLAO|nr:hypothetical protein [Aurantibacter aestuarii]PSG86571.1 hypothetical protein C7H52_12885 [Aurantibacter aestuarii]